ncbi:MAG: Xcc1710-like domain-containing protein [Gammaproteobacteria bacterium]|nr:Xcc1710-like domain-containing protein [Gammaproteobacteria bacterium]
MPLTEDKITSRYHISGYHDNAIIINDTHYQNSLVVSTETLHSPWAVNSIEDLNKNNIQVIFNLEPEVVLLGTGMRQQFPAAKISALFAQQGIGVEVMNNGALCRTFNILVAEGRAVVAGILLGN